MHFAGARRDLGNILAAIDVFVMPSLWEGLPLSLVLAMGAGLPVIATRVAGIPEVVRGRRERPAGDARRRGAAGRRDGARAAATTRLRARLGAGGARVRAAALRRRRLRRVGHRALRPSCSRARGQIGVTLGILYHMPFWQAADGSLWEAEGSFARYVDSLAPYFDEIVLSVPVFDRAAGVRLARARLERAAGAAAVFPGPAAVLSDAAAHPRPAASAWVEQCDVIHLRVPTPAAIFAFRIARARRKPVFLLVVGDYEALLPHLPYRGVKKTLFGAYVALRRVGAPPHDDARADVCQRRGAARASTRRDGAPRVRNQDHHAQPRTTSRTRTDTCAVRPDPRC